ncbi:MAG: hypothetical protein ISR47_01665 [Rhodospirillales bacterium]|nr:hypothetical protein [Rhodospirillales bacterium]
MASDFIGSNFSVGRALANLGNAAARPNFELQFSILQNSLLDRLSEKIDALKEDSSVNNVDAFLTLETNRLNRIIPLINKYEDDTTNNYLTTNGFVDDLNSLEALASGGDATAFDNLIARLDADLQRVKTVSGLAIGFVVKDGMATIQDEGLGISNYASYGDDASRETAVSEARDKIEIALSVMTINLDNARDLKFSVESDIVSVTLQIEAVQIAEQSEKLAEIEKLRTESGRLLEALSLAFEVNASRAETLSEALLNPPKFNNGSVLDLLV